MTPDERTGKRPLPTGRFAVLSDVHGNYPALRAVLQDIDGRFGNEAPALFFCGDAVGYGPFPNECCEALRERGAACVLGNHDACAVNPSENRRFNRFARAALQWTRERLTPENAAWLDALPTTLRRDDGLFVHGSPNRPAEWRYVLDAGDAEDAFRAFEERLCFIGHSHVPGVFEMRPGAGVRALPGAETVPLDPASRHLVDVGSVGQPRDGDPRACWTLVDMKSGAAFMRRAAYPVLETQQAVLGAGLPRELAGRLELGL